LRAGFRGRLKVKIKNGREYPPTASDKTICATRKESEPYACYDCGKNKHVFEE